jgi:hypothetical protein
LSKPGVGHLNTELGIASQSNAFTPPRWPRSRS